MHQKNTMSGLKKMLQMDKLLCYDVSTTDYGRLILIVPKERAYHNDDEKTHSKPEFG